MTTIEFAMHLHQPFQVEFNSLLTLWLALEAVQQPSITELTRSEDAGSFEVLFQGPPYPVLPTRAYQLSHPSLGKFYLLLVPYERRQTGMCYKAVV